MSFYSTGHARPAFAQAVVCPRRYVPFARAKAMWDGLKWRLSSAKTVAKALANELKHGFAGFAQRIGDHFDLHSRRFG